MLSVAMTHCEAPCTMSAVKKCILLTLQDKLDVRTASLVMAKYNIARRTVTEIRAQASVIQAEIEASDRTRSQKTQRSVNFRAIEERDLKFISIARNNKLPLIQYLT